MKQYITESQLNELSEKAQWKLHNYKFLSSRSLSTKGITLPILSIGEIIEFLDKQKVFYNTSFPSPCHSVKHISKEDGKWGLATYYDYEGHWQDKKGFKELVDALWEAVKEILEK